MPRACGGATRVLLGRGGRTGRGWFGLELVEGVRRVLGRADAIDDLAVVDLSTGRGHASNLDACLCVGGGGGGG
jgi:hypothetical protein